MLLTWIQSLFLSFFFPSFGLKHTENKHSDLQQLGGSTQKCVFSCFCPRAESGEKGANVKMCMTVQFGQINNESKLDTFVLGFFAPYSQRRDNGSVAHEGVQVSQGPWVKEGWKKGPAEGFVQLLQPCGCCTGQAELSIYPSVFILTLTYGHELHGVVPTLSIRQKVRGGDRRGTQCRSSVSR